MCSGFPEKIDSGRSKKSRPGGLPRQIQGAQVFVPIRDENPLRTIRFQYVTIGLIALNAAVFGLMAFGNVQANGFTLVPTELLQAGLLGGAIATQHDGIALREPLTLLTYMFLHGDVLHLLSNMLFLWVFGDNVEDAMGHRRFLAFYLACGSVAGLAHVAMLPTSTLPLIGASGAVAGVIAAYVMLHPRVHVWVLAFRFLPLRITAAYVLGLWIITQFVMLVVPDSSPIAWSAHVGGIVAGAALVPFLRRPGVPLFGRSATAP